MTAMQQRAFPVHSPGRLEALARNQDALSNAGCNLDRLFGVIVNQSIAAIPKAQGAIVELLESGDLIYCAASGDARRFVGRRLPAAGSFAGRSIASNTAMIVADLEEAEGLDLPRYRDAGMRAVMAVPFRRGENSFGAIKFYSGEPAAFAELDLIVARLIAGQLIGSLARIQEQTVARDAQEADTRFHAIAESLPQMIWAMTSMGQPVDYNRHAYEYLRFEEREDEANGVMSAFGRELAEMGTNWEQASTALRPLSFECRIDMPSGPPRWFQINLAPVVMEGRDVEEWLGIGTDIDDLKTLGNSLEDAIRSRELLLVEVSHRAKNSLQIITGLLAMHASKITHPEAKARLMDARAQIGTIAQVYDTIHQTSEHDKVEFVVFIRSLATSLLGSAAERQADLVFDAPDTLWLPIQRGVPVALIAGEIITNAIKHATAHDGARITISIRADERGCSVDIADDGPGLPPDFDPERSAGLGMDIIFGLARQIGGEIVIDRGHAGARFCLRLPR